MCLTCHKFIYICIHNTTQYIITVAQYLLNEKVDGSLLASSGELGGRCVYRYHVPLQYRHPWLGLSHCCSTHGGTGDDRILRNKMSSFGTN